MLRRASQGILGRCGRTLAERRATTAMSEGRWVGTMGEDDVCGREECVSIPEGGEMCLYIPIAMDGWNLREGC